MAKFLFLMFLMIKTTLGEFTPCLGSEVVVCKCSFDRKIALCINKHLQQMPTFSEAVLKKLEQMHVERNNITIWPAKEYWANFPRLSIVIADYNPICNRPKDAPTDIDFIITPCRTSKFVSQ